MRKIYSPFQQWPDAWIALPDTWLGLHVQRRDKAVEETKEQGNTLTNFAVSLALLEDWNLPGLSGNPEKWDFAQLDLMLILWVINEVMTDFGKCFVVPKGLPSPLPAGEATQAHGDSAVTGSE